MLILLAIFLPPVAVFMCGKPMSALLNFFLCFLFVIPGIVHAIMVVNEHKADKRMEKLTKAMKAGS